MQSSRRIRATRSWGFTARSGSTLACAKRSWRLNSARRPLARTAGIHGSIIKFIVIVPLRGELDGAFGEDAQTRVITRRGNFIAEDAAAVIAHDRNGDTGRPMQREPLRLRRFGWNHPSGRPHNPVVNEPSRRFAPFVFADFGLRVIQSHNDYGARRSGSDAPK